MLKRQTKLLLNMTFLLLLNKTLNLAQESLLYDSRSDRKWISKKISEIFLISTSRCSRIFSKEGHTKNLSYTSHLYFIFSTIFYNTLLYPFQQTLWYHGGSSSREKPWTSNVKTEQWLMWLGRPRAIENMQFFVTYQIDVASNQFFYPLNSNNYLGKTSWGESCTDDWQTSGWEEKNSWILWEFIIYFFFYLLRGYTTPNFGTLSRGQPY